MKLVVHFTEHPLSPQSHCLTSQFPNSMQNVVTSVRLSWASGFKKPRPILLKTWFLVKKLYVHLVVAVNLEMPNLNLAAFHFKPLN